MLIPAVARAQSEGTVAGLVRDAVTHAPMKSVTAMLRDPADSTARTLGDITGEKGTFSIPHAAIGRKYTLEVRYAGYERYTVENVVVTAAKPNIDVGEVLLKPQPVELGGVEVAAPREQVVIRADKTVYSVESNPTYTATNVSELLGQIPAIQVDQDGKISLRGSENVTIMMNDRPLTMPREQRDKFLQSLPVSMVKDIEVRTNPGAQFEAKNQGGIINIVTRRTMSDVIGGNVNAGGDSRIGATGGAGLYFNGKELTASLGGGAYHGPNHSTSSSTRLNYLDSVERRSDGAGTSESVSDSWYGYGQADYAFTEHDLASLSFNLNHWSSDHTAFGAHAFYNASDVVVGRFYDTSMPDPASPSSGNYNSASLLLKHTFEKDHKLSLDVSYNSSAYEFANLYNSTYFRANGEFDSVRSTRRNSTSEQSQSTVIASLDYANPISDKVTLTLGGRNEINSLDNNTTVSNWDRLSGAFALDSLQTNHYLPHNSVYALYGNAAWTPFDAFTVQAGLRAERANVSAKYASGVELISRDYSNLFPSGSLSYTVATQHTFTFSYRRSIALPDVDALNPTQVKWNDQYVYSGNPDLTPEFTQSFELGYNTYWGMGNMISVQPYYSTTNGNIESSQQLVNGATYATSANFNGTYSIGVEASLAMRPTDWLNFRLSGGAYRKVNRGSAVPGDIYSSSEGGSGNASINADLMKGLTFSTSLYAELPATVGGNKGSSFVLLSFTLRQKLLDDKFSITMKVNDPFNWREWHTTYTSPEFYTEMTSKWSSQFVGLSISYNFGTIPRMESHKQEKTETKGGGGSGGSGGGGGQ